MFRSQLLPDADGRLGKDWGEGLRTIRGGNRRTSYLQIHSLQRKQSGQWGVLAGQRTSTGRVIPVRGSRGRPSLPRLAHMRIFMRFIVFPSQAWTHGSSVHPSHFTSGWARKTEGNTRMVITTLTPGWTDVTPSSHVILTDSRQDKDSTETKGNVKTGRKCPPSQWKINFYSLH